MIEFFPKRNRKEKERESLVQGMPCIWRYINSIFSRDCDKQSHKTPSCSHKLNENVKNYW